jgi:hypothetical protein
MRSDASTRRVVKGGRLRRRAYKALPSWLTLEPATGRISLRPAVGRGQVSREDVALVIAAALSDDSTIGRTIEFNIGDVPIADALAGG